MELRPLAPKVGAGPLADGIRLFDGLAVGDPTAREASTVGGWITAREVKPLTPTTGGKTVEENVAAAENCPSVNGVADAIETGVPVVRALDMIVAASEVGAFASAGVDDSTLKLTGTPIAGMVDKPGMKTDEGPPDGDVSTGPGTLKPEFLTIPLSVAEVSMAADADTLGSDVSTGPGILNIELLRISLIVAEVSGLEEKP